MAKRLFTADWHLGMEAILKLANRGKEFGGPFSTVEEMDQAILSSAYAKSSPGDTIIHVGDLACFKADQDGKGLDVNPMQLVAQLPCQLVNIHGNHDDTNKVKSICDSMQIHFGSKFPAVFVCHFPSYDRRANGKFLDGSIMLCGHVHNAWKHCLDLDHSVLNINVGVDAWNYEVLTEDELVKHIMKVIATPKQQLTKARIIEGKITYV